MLKLIVGTKGSGKTKTMIDMIDKAVKTTSGNIVVIEKCMKLTTEINHSARLVDVDEYGVAGADMLYGFVAGVLAGNYDITELFLDGILRITDHDMAAAAKVLNAIDKITSNIEVVVTVSANAADLPEDLRFRGGKVFPAPIFCGKSKKISTFCVLQVDKTLSLVYTI